MLSLHSSKAAALLATITGIYFLLSPRTFEVAALSVHLEIVNALLVIFVSTLVLVVASYSHRNLQGQPRLTRFGLFLTAALVGLLVMVTAGTLVQFALGWTLSGQATASLIAHANTRASRRAARYVRSWLTASDAFVWLSVALLALPSSGEFSFAFGEDFTFAASAAGFALVVASIVRTGLVPAHRWLAQTAEAPSPVSAFLHAGIINAAGISVALWLPLMRPWLPLLLISACASLIVGLLTMKNRTDIKGQLASSTNLQMAFMSIEAAVGLPGLALAHLIGHGSYKSWCFLRAGGAITRRRLGHVPNRPSMTVLAIGLSVSIATALGSSVLIQSFEPLTIVVGVIAATSVIVYGYSGSAKRLGTIAIVTSLALAGYLAAAHLWLTWIPLPQWTSTPLLVIALVSMLIAAATTILPTSAARRVSWYLIAPRWMRVPRKANLHLPEPPPTLAKAELTVLNELIDTARGCVEPSWPLRTAVAVNPVSSLTNLEFNEAAAVANTWGAQLYSSPATYLELWEAGAIDARHLSTALGDASNVNSFIERTRECADARVFADYETPSPAWEMAHRWCQLAWPTATTEGNVFAQWRESLPREVAATISPDAITALSQALDAHCVRQNAENSPTSSSALRLRTLTQLLATAPGWAAHAQWRGRDAVVQLLALRACITAIYSEILTTRHVDAFPEAVVWQQALEATFDQWLSNQLATSGHDDHQSSQAKIGLVTCIDVRSEPMRRALEATGQVRTYGAAGFFGVDAALHVNGDVIGLAPVIVSPSVLVEAKDKQTWITDLSKGINRTMEGLGGLAIAEGFGITALGASLMNTFAPQLSPIAARLTQPDVWLGTTGLEISELSTEQQLTYARSFLESLGHEELPNLMVIAGHTADAANNAFAAAYQCGACGGNSGAINARLIAAMLSNPIVRQHLISDGYGIEKTRFVAALHNTTSNTIILDPTTHKADDLDQITDQLIHEAKRAQQHLLTRQTSLPGAPSLSRGCDWAQPFPEWGLVGNAACVVGPRELTAGADLGGRVFLHEYDWTSDPDGSLLNGILAGPGAVMHMINMQYYCSTVDQTSFGSLDKTRHNVVGDLGVLVGASGDLHYGLPWQSLGVTPDQSMHVPVRLRILVAAPAEHLELAMRGTSVEKLAANGWLSIKAIESSPSDLRDLSDSSLVNMPAAS